jgi:hypothetical protein
MECFTHWLSAEERNSEINNYIHLSLKMFEKDSRIHSVTELKAFRLYRYNFLIIIVMSILV